MCPVSCLEACRTHDCQVAGSNLTRSYCVPMQTQSAIPLWLVNDYQRKLGSKRAQHIDTTVS